MMKIPKTKNIIRSFGIFLVSISIGLTACKSSKKSLATTNNKLETKTKTELLNETLANELKYKTISGKISLELQSIDSKKKNRSSAQMKLIRDSIIQISVRPLSVFEAFRLDITPKSIVLVDRLRKKYAVEDISQLQQSQGVLFNFYNLQALLTNSIFLPGEKKIEPAQYNQFSINSTSDTHLLKTKDKSDILYNFAIDASNHLASTLISSKNRDYILQWTYTNFMKDGDYIYPTLIKANVDVKKNRFDANIEYSKLDIDQQFELDSSIPRNKYTKVSIIEIISAYMKSK